MLGIEGRVLPFPRPIIHSLRFMAIAAERGKWAFRKVEKALLRLAEDHDADSVHDFRTSSRRLETLLERIIDTGGRNQKKLLKSLSRIRKSAGQVRDIDVQLAALRSLKTSQEPRRKTQLTQRLLELRAQHEKKLRKLLNEKDVREIRKRLKKASGALELESSQDPLGVAKDMLRSVALPAGAVEEDMLHRYRMTVKQARYAAEFAVSSAEVSQFLARSKQLQDALGHWHDWQTLTHTAIDRLGDVNQSPLVAALYNVTRGKYRHAIATVSSIQSGGPGAAVKLSAAEAARPIERRKIDPDKGDPKNSASAIRSFAAA